MNPCTPIRLMPNAAWRAFLARHPGWTAPARVLGPCVRAGALSAHLVAPGVAAVPVLAGGVVQPRTGIGLFAPQISALSPVRPVEGVGFNPASAPSFRGGSPLTPAPYHHAVQAGSRRSTGEPAPILPRAPLALDDLPAAAPPNVVARPVPEPRTLALLLGALVFGGVVSLYASQARESE